MAAVAALAEQASAQAPVAIVEDVKSGSAGVEFMDYVEPGKRVPLQGGDTLTLGYLKSCWRESIVGGTVTVGPEQSDVRGGTVTRTKEQCDSGQMQLTPEQAKQSGAMAFRRVPKPGAAKAPEEPSLTLYGRMPVFELRQAGRLLIERLDQPGEPIAIDVQGHQLVRGAFFDLARSGGTALAVGGLYRASHSGRQVAFKIAESAAPGATPLVGRLVRFQSPR